jgi:protein-tyrosine phosphatase
MIDIHLHILPGVDDGPATLPESLSFAQTLVQEGVRVAIATPHYNDEFPRLPAAEIQNRVNDLQRELARCGIPLRLFAGHEVLIKPGLVEDVQMGRVATLGGSRYLLLELWNSVWLPETERVIFELQAHGITPILAHPERYRAVQKDPERLAALLQRGALTQLTASSLTGAQGRTARSCAEILLKKGLIHCIASDAHGSHVRLPSIQKGLQSARELLGDERVYQMTEVWPAVILRNEVYNPTSTKPFNA